MRDERDERDEHVERVTRLARAFAVDERELRAYVADHPEGRAALEAADDAPLEELALAAALRARSPAAARAFEATYVAPLGRSLAKLALGEADLDEVKQRTREKLLVPAAGETRLKIEAYAGQGKLAGLVHVVATREALSVFRREKRAALLGEDALAERALGGDPAVELLKGRAREAFAAAFEAAVGSLEARPRNLLRLHLLGGVTLEQLATMHGVHRATVVRWLAGAREHVLVRTRRAMEASLGARGSELESVLRALESRLGDVSVARILGDGEG